MTSRTGASLIELLVVVAIIGTLLGLLLPAVQMARERARETVCKNHVYQINFAVVQHMEVYKKLPRPGRIGKIGGWIIDILPFIEQQNLHANIKTGVDVANAPEGLYLPPPIFRCPKSSDSDSTPTDPMSRGHYTLVTLDNRKRYAGVYDSPIDLHVAWGTGPEMDYHQIRQAKGPHHDGFHFSSGSQQGVGFTVKGEDVY